MAVIKKTDNNKCWQGFGEIGAPLILAGKMVQTLWKTAWQFLEKLNIALPHDPASLLLGINPRKLKTYIYITSALTFIAVLFINAKTWKQPRCSPPGGWINKMWHIHTMEYYSATSRNAVLAPATTWMQLENVMLSERSQSQKATTCMIPLMWNIQNRQIRRDRK